MRPLANLLAAVPLVLVAACSNDEPPVTADQQATWVIPSGTATEAPIPSNRTTEATPSGGGTAAAAGVSRCHTGSLTARTGGVESTAGVLYLSLVFTNKSPEKCSLTGYPTVSWVSAKTGKTVNKPFAPDAGTASPVVLEPGAQAHATLAYHQPGEADPAKCKPVTVKGYRVVPPRESTSIFVTGATVACSSTGINTGKVLAIIAGAK
ncbi:DUF4232 domain-containing protein [Actinoplanes sp. KI2]|uniref:DUF4232 domain-containing protein n=1 Tax=Actinoplanes sp. KI2 TaxID=2983315 RepID=UPI0021D5DFAB|nr:DUF4232 domain-containing protein [Actinoplanes sp. KI2]MCU7726941.1 DUF4232 domain-containing protein [Actinoplanes sp. KI2]